MSFEPMATVYEKGIAVGRCAGGKMVFRFRDETFEFDVQKAPLSYFNGYWYEASIDEVRRLEAEAAGG
jgi:hypothetical protein